METFIATKIETICCAGCVFVYEIDSMDRKVSGENVSCALCMCVYDRG